MTYNPNIPLSSDRPSQSQSQILTNFSELNTVFSVNHVAFDNVTIANRGKHNDVSLLQQAADPAAVVGEGQLYTKQIASVPAPSYRIAAGIYGVPLVINAGDFATINGTANTYDFSGQPAMMGTVQCVDLGNFTRTLFSPFQFDGGAIVNLPGANGQLASGASLIKFQGSGSILQIVATIVTTIRIKVFLVIT